MDHFDAIVSGGNGFLWRYLLLSPLSSEFRLCFIGRETPGPDVRFEPVDLSASNAVSILDKKSLRSGTFLHFAAPTPGSSSVTMRAETIALAENCAAIALSCGAGRFVHASSGAVYGQDWPGQKTETDAPNPITDYGEAKMRAEEIIDRHFLSSAHGRHTTHLRLHFPAPPIDALCKAVGEGRSTRLFAQIVRQILAGKMIQLDEAEFRFNPCPGLALTGLLRIALDKGNKLPRVVNVAGAYQVTLEEIVLRMGTILGSTPRFKRLRGPTRSMLADCVLFQSIVGDAAGMPLF